jgi:hypothetical protein
VGIRKRARCGIHVDHRHRELLSIRSIRFTVGPFRQLACRERLSAGIRSTPAL